MLVRGLQPVRVFTAMFGGIIRHEGPLSWIENQS